MGKFRELTHVYYECDYHIVFTPKYRFRILDGLVKSVVEHDLQMISQWYGVNVIELNVQKDQDHIHLLCLIPPKISVSDYMGSWKGNLAVKLFKSYPELKQSFVGGIIFGFADIL